jgi:hypothetical protein
MIWAIELDAADASACGMLRHDPGIEACIQQGRLWLRSKSMNEALAARLLRLPACGRYEVTNSGALVAQGTRVPHGRLPEGTWLALRFWLPLERPPAQSAIAPVLINNVGLTLVRSDSLREANVLEVSLRAWTALATEAPAIRLAKWSFAVDNSGTTLVRGTPLPALPGQRLVEEGGVAVNAGLTWFPRVSPDVIREMVGADDTDLIILSDIPNSSGVCCRIIPGDSFVRATRSAVRLTALNMEGPAQ